MLRDFARADGPRRAARPRRSAPLELVDGNDVRDLQHADLLELGGGPVLGGHDVEGDVRCSSAIDASPWPMPGVSTMTRSKPAALHALMASPRCSGTCGGRRAPGRQSSGRTPGTARTRSGCSSGSGHRGGRRRRVAGSGRWRCTATRSLSSWSRRSRRISSSVSDDFPDPPVPVMPSTGTHLSGLPLCTSQLRQAPSERPASSTVMRAAPDRRTAAPDSTSSKCWGLWPPGRCRTRLDRRSLIIPARPSRLAVFGSEDPSRRARLQQVAISAGTMTPPPLPKTWTWPAPDFVASRSLR